MTDLLLDIIATGERINTGAEWLDQHEPNWVVDINLAELQLADCESCVLGQVGWERYREQVEFDCTDGYGYLTGIWADERNGTFISSRYGFDITLRLFTPDIKAYAFRLLDAGWTALIKNRFNEGLS